MLKRWMSIILVFCLVGCTACVASSAAVSGQISDTLSWELSTIGRLTITGEGESIPDYALLENEQSTAPWGSFAGQVMSLSLPSTLTQIGDYAFAGCANLKQVSLPSRLVQLGTGAFRNCGLTTLELPLSLKSVPDACFESCEDLTAVTFPQLTSGYMGATQDGVQRIGDYAFAYCASLQKLQFPFTLQRIGALAFNKCIALKSVSFEKSGEALTKIGEGAFMYCSALTAFTIPETVTTVPAACFRGSGLKTVKLHKELTSVGKYAFAFCDDLARIDVHNDTCTFYDEANTTSQKARLYCTGIAKNTITYAEKYEKPLTVLCVGRVSHPKFKTKIVKASAKAEGSIYSQCPSCGWSSTQKIAQIKTVKLTKTAFIYNGKKQMPTETQVSVIDAEGKEIAASAYTVTCGTAGKAVGQHWVKISFQSGSNYTGSFVRYYTILPKGTAIKSATPAKGALKVYWNKQATQTTGYQIRLCKKADFKSGVIVKTVKNNKTTSLNITKLAKKTGYYMQIRTYKTVAGKHYFSAWSKAFGRKTK